MTKDTTHQPRRLAKLIGLALAVALTLGACGSAATSDDASSDLPTLDAGADDGSNDDGSSDEDGENEEVTEEDAEAAMAEYEKCMADFGIEINMAGTEGADIDSTQVEDGAGYAAAPTDEDSFEEASETCDPILEDAFGDFEMSPEQEAELADQMLEMQKCLADAGFDIDMSGGAFELDADIDFDAFDAAMQKCEPAGIQAEGSDQ